MRQPFFTNTNQNVNLNESKQAQFLRSLEDLQNNDQISRYFLKNDSSIVIDTSDILGEGESGPVFPATLNGMPVAAKRLSFFSSRVGANHYAECDPIKKARNIVDTCYRIGMLNHPNIIKVHGILIKGAEAYFVTERCFCSLGDLNRYFEEKTFGFNRDEQKLLLIHSCELIAKVLSRLHEQGLVYQDMVHHNKILLGMDGTPRLPAFGFGLGEGYNVTVNSVEPICKGTCENLVVRHTDGQEYRSRFYSFALDGGFCWRPEQDKGKNFFANFDSNMNSKMFARMMLWFFAPENRRESFFDPEAMQAEINNDQLYQLILPTIKKGLPMASMSDMLPQLQDIKRKWVLNKKFMINLWEKYIDCLYIYRDLSYPTDILWPATSQFVLNTAASQSPTLFSRTAESGEQKPHAQSAQDRQPDSFANKPG